MLRGGIVAMFVLFGCAGAKCPTDVKVLDSLNLTRYEGIWYEVASENLAFLSGCSCSRYNYKLTGAQTYDDHFSCTKGGKPAGISLTLKGKIPDLSKPAVQEESPLLSWLPNAPYLVLEVGHEYEYAVVYACVDLPLGSEVETTYIFHRDPQAVTKKLLDMDGINGRLKAQGIGYEKIKVVPQPTDCSYPPTLANSTVASETFDSTCAKPGDCGLAYQTCCAGFQAKGFPCGCHLKDGTGQSGADCGTCGTAYSACCLGFKAKGHPCTCDISGPGVLV